MKGMDRQVGVVVRRRGLRVPEGAVARMVGVLDSQARRFRGGCPQGELSVAFLSDAELAMLHGRFLGDPSPTDVITFEGNGGLGTAGEVCVSVDAARRRAGRGAAFARELSLYVVHGWLHLAGYDDTDACKRRAMRRAEARALALLALSRALPRFVLA